MSRATGSAIGKTWFGQPRGLTILFLTETWEQFSFYGMRTLLVYYMTRQLQFAQEQASLVYGLYTAFIYFTPIIGGQIADRWLGRRRAVLIGGSIMAAGHFMMAFEGAFYPALVTICIGEGLFLPSLPSQINGLYKENDPRRGSAYNVYYVGVNLGGFLAPFVCGTLGEIYGWHWGFTAAGVGLCLGMVVYMLGQPYLPKDEPQSVQRVQREHDSNLRSTLMLLGAVVIVVVIFRVVYAQTGNTLALWIADSVNRDAGGVTLPMTWFQALNPLIVFLFTPLLVRHWTRRAAKGREKTPLQKMAIGSAMVAASFLLLAGVASVASSTGTSASWIWPVVFFVLMTTGELYILPTGLGLFARLAPAGFAATAVAAWFFAAFVGYLAGGFIGTLWSSIPHAAFFLLMTAMALVAAALLYLLDRPARRVDAANAARMQQAEAMA